MRATKKIFEVVTVISSISLFSLMMAGFADAQISGEVRDGKLFVFSSQPTEMLGIDFVSPNSLLTPLPEGASANPFTFLLSNSPQQITWGTLGSSVTLDGEWATQAGYTGTDTSELQASWGQGQNSVPFPVSLIQAVPEVPVVTPPTGSSLSVSVNDANRFVLHANDFSLENLLFRSESGGLVPAENAAPFPSLITNDSTQISYLSPNTLTLDGAITLSAGWNGSQNDLLVETFSDKRLRPIHSGAIAQCVDCPLPTLGVSFDEDQRFVLQGNNHQLRELDFYSNGSLVPAESAAPFVGLESNTAEHISYRALEGVTIDGAVTLSSRWDANGTVGDVRYGYTDTDGNSVSQLAIPNASYAQNRHLDAIVNDDNRIVLTGTGHRVNSVEFTSRSESLVPGTSSGPFDSIALNSPDEIAFFHSDGNVVLDGQILLDIGWNPEGERDVQFRYDGVGNSPDGGYYLSRGSYPTGTDEPRPDVWVSVDRDYKLIIHADDKSLVGVNAISNNEILLPVATPDPFQTVLSNEADQVAIGVLGAEEAVQVTGSLKTDIGINPLLETEAIFVAFGDGAGPIEIEVLESDLAICPGCAVPEVSFVPGGQLLIEGFEAPLARVEITSASGSLVPLTIDAEEFAVLFASDSEIRLAAAEGVDAFLRQALPVAWNIEGLEDIQFEFTTIEGAVLGPFALAEATFEQALPEPSSHALIGMAFVGMLTLRRKSR